MRDAVGGAAACAILRRCRCGPTASTTHLHALGIYSPSYKVIAFEKNVSEGGAIHREALYRESVMAGSFCQSKQLTRGKVES
eukprot:942755-Pleurochrysis_carterae.AAC.1